MMTRRQFLATLTSAAAAAGSTMVAGAQFSEQPDHVTISGLSDAQSEIEQYQPLVDYRRLEIEPTAVYGWRATSNEYDYDWYSYWHWYVKQDAPSNVATHLPDREPITVAVDPGNGVDHVVYSQWHYSAGVDTTPTLYQGTHPNYRSIYPYHHFEPTSSERGQLLTLSDFTDTYDDWLVNGWNVNRRAVVDPPFAEERENWWREDDQFNHRLAVRFHEANEMVPINLGNPFRLDD